MVFFRRKFRTRTRDLDYQLRVTNWDGSEYLMRDPYQYGPILARSISTCSVKASIGALRKVRRTSAEDRRCRRRYFSVWAPNAQRVSVVGDFNGWDGRVNPMRKLLGTGVWEYSYRASKKARHYKWEIRAQSGALLLKSDPFAFSISTEHRQVRSLQFGAIPMERCD